MYKILLSLFILLSICINLMAAPEIINPSFENGGIPDTPGVGYVRQGYTIEGWKTVADAGRNTGDMPFYDNGITSDGEWVCMLQNASSISQVIKGFEAGKVYRLSIRANSRAIDKENYGFNGSLKVSLNRTILIFAQSIEAVDAPDIHQSPFHEYTCDFMAGNGDFLLDIAQTGGGNGVSIVVDDIQLEELPAGSVAQVQVNQAQAVGVAEAPEQPDLNDLNWIWSSMEPDAAKNAQPATWYFRKEFDFSSDRPVKSAYLLLAADNSCDVMLNDQWLGQAEDFLHWYRIDMKDALQPGQNVLSLVGVNGGDSASPAGIAGVMVILTEDASMLQTLPLDTSWRCTQTPEEGWTKAGFDDSGWLPVIKIAAMGESPWGRVGYLSTMPAKDFPQFQVPGFEDDMKNLRRLFALHYPNNSPVSTLWDQWLPMSILWPATSATPGPAAYRDAWRSMLLRRPIDREGYVSTMQHVGGAHSEGWPFPLWCQSNGIGWHFSLAEMPFAGFPGMEKPSDRTQWEYEGIEDAAIDERFGWKLDVISSEAALTSPEFDVDTLIAPFILIEWKGGPWPRGARAFLQWTTDTSPEYSEANSVVVPLPDKDNMTCENVPLYRHLGWSGRLTGLRLVLENMQDMQVVIRRIHTAVDTRHPLNNTNYIQGCVDYLNWSGDISFLQENISRMRTSLQFAKDEFRTEEEGCVLVPWVGHDGRAGFTVNPDGSKTIHYGHGIGNGYWDLMPFGWKETPATTYYYDAVKRMAAVEKLIEAHPEWGIGTQGRLMAPNAMLEHAEKIKLASQEMFWNLVTGRFNASIDADGISHDYGYTFVNCEAIYYDFTTKEQAESIIKWLDGERIIETDTAQGEDIYHWRFAPRATTLRNIDWYGYAWYNPEMIPWGYQVQDGGAVLGFSYHDLMARLKTLGPDNAWARLQEITKWFGEVMAEGGYRQYYSDPARGTLQGGGPPGGLGMDCEFFESVLVPQTMLYGFMGFQPGVEGFSVNPQLPSDWPSLRIQTIAYHNLLLDISATHDSIIIGFKAAPDLSERVLSDEKLQVTLPTGAWNCQWLDDAGEVVTQRIVQATDLRQIDLKNTNAVTLVMSKQ